MQTHTRARRRFLQATVPASVLSVAAAAGLLRPVAAHAQFPFLNFRTPRQAAQPPAAAPVAVPDTRLTPLQRLLRDLRQARPENSTSVDILSPEIAVDGASIMLDFQALLPEVDAFAVYIDGNPQPLARGLLLIFGMGSIAGPAIGGPLMDGFGPGTLPAYSATVLGLLGLLGLLRLIWAVPIPLIEQGRFVPMVRTTPVVLKMLPRTDTQTELDLPPPSKHL